MLTYFQKRDSILSFKYPNGWVVLDEGEIISVYNPTDGLGALQFSLYPIQEESEVDQISDFNWLLSERHPGLEIQAKNNYLYCDTIDQDFVFWKYWFFYKDSVYIFATYNCAYESIGVEDKQIEIIIESVLN
jgi:hypothetical protein